MPLPPRPLYSQSERREIAIKNAEASLVSQILITPPPVSSSITSIPEAEGENVGWPCLFLVKSASTATISAFLERIIGKICDRCLIFLSLGSPRTERQTASLRRALQSFRTGTRVLVVVPSDRSNDATMTDRLLMSMRKSPITHHPGNAGASSRRMDSCSAHVAITISLR